MRGQVQAGGRGQPAQRAEVLNSRDPQTSAAALAYFLAGYLGPLPTKKDYKERSTSEASRFACPRFEMQMLIALALLLQEAAKAREAAMLAREERRASKAKAREQKEQERKENNTVNKRRRQALAVVLAGTPVTPVTPVPVFTPVPVALAPMD